MSKKESVSLPAKSKILFLDEKEIETLHQLCIMVGKYGIDVILENLEPIEREYNVRG